MSGRGQRRSRRAPRPLPRGRHGLPRAFVVTNQRERLLDAVAQVASAKGYATATVQDVIDYAGVSRRTFYEQFANKEECFLAAYDTVVQAMLGQVLSAYSHGERSWPQRLWVALSTFFELLAAEPAFARMCLVEVLGAGQQALQRRDAVLDQFTILLEPGRFEVPPGTRLPDQLAQAIIGGVHEAAYLRILHNRTASLPMLVPDILYCVLVPYLGHERALAASDAAASRPPRTLAPFEDGHHGT